VPVHRKERLVPSSTYTTEPAVNPLAPLVELAGQLTSTMLHVCCGLAAGLIVAHALRRRHLRWTWVTAALAPLALDPTMFSGWWAASCAQPCAVGAGIAKT
jgi:hypothetical protein